MERSQIHFPPKDAPLRADVRVLGALVGAVIREQGGDELFERVEAARKAAIRRREGDEGAGGELDDLIRGRTAGDAELLVRAFSSYFQVVNMAEKVHRIRRRRDYLREEEIQPGSFLDAVSRLRDAGLGLKELETILRRVQVEPVFTAHPSQATRATILEKQQRIARSLVDRLDPSLTPQEEAAAMGRIRAEVTATWQTEEHQRERPSVLDELDHVLFHLKEIVYRVVPPFYESLADAVNEVYGAASEGVGGSAPGEGSQARERLPTIVRFASWVGGDMDGNPNVTADTIRAALGRQRQIILERYRFDCTNLADRLSQSLSRVGVGEEVLARIDAYRASFQRAFESIPSRYRDMPYRVLLDLMIARLDATGRGERAGYRHAEEFREDVRRVLTSLEANRGHRAGAFAVRRLLRRTETFGFHLATLDVRQNAAVHRRVVGRLLDGEEWDRLEPAARTRRLGEAIREGAEPRGSPDEEAERTLEVFRAIGECRALYGPEAIGPYIISMTHGPDDVLSVLLLARWAGLLDDLGAVPLDVAPLLETVDDLERADRIVEAALGEEIYRRHVDARGGRQIVMVGYSDSNKDGGLAASRWALQQAQRALVDVTQQAGLELTIFHGRGGTIGRGGGKTHRAVLAAPRGAVDGRLRMTEQGEVIDDKYGLRGIAERTLEQTVGAVALATAIPRSPEPGEDRWRSIMEGIADASRNAYVALVYEDPEFIDYFRTATPIDVIERMPIGSRPPSRSGGDRIEDLRAIPWVFAWTQSRHLLPGWFGLGSGLLQAMEEHGEGAVGEMVSEWPFIEMLLSDAEMVLAKADMPTAARYARLAGDMGERIFARIEEEHGLTVDLVTRIKGTGALLEEEPTLQRSIRLRNPYVDPMSLLQVDLLERWRETGREDEDLFHALLSTVRGIANGLQNTG